MQIHEISSRLSRLLVVDDNAQNIELLTALMEAEGYEVISAADVWRLWLMWLLPLRT